MFELNNLGIAQQVGLVLLHEQLLVEINNLNEEKIIQPLMFQAISLLHVNVVKYRPITFTAGSIASLTHDPNCKALQLRALVTNCSMINERKRSEIQEISLEHQLEMLSDQNNECLNLITCELLPWLAPLSCMNKCSSGKATSTMSKGIDLLMYVILGIFDRGPYTLGNAQSIFDLPKFLFSKD